MPRELLNKVLLVDDDPAILRMLSVQLNRGGYEVLTADSGRQALQYVQQEEPSFLIADWDMPGLNGLELCMRVRQLDLPHYVYVVIITGRSGEGDLQAAMDAGADDFLVKPLCEQALFARLTAGARVVRLESRLSQLADQDALTGLYARRAFTALVNKAWKQARRERKPLSIVLFDIDYFKRINDELGHPAGDQVIRYVAELVAGSARESDILGRYGGEEFCALLPGTDEPSARLWADRMRSRLQQATIPVGPNGLQVTVSGGVAEMLADMEEPSELLELTDQCLRAAKQQGRNRVVSRQELCEAYADAGPDCDSGWNQLPAREVMIPLVHCLRGDWPVTRGAAYLLRYRIASAPVIDEQSGLLGIISDADVLTVAEQAEAGQRRLSEVVRTNVVTYDQTTPVKNIFRFMTRSSIRSVVITADGQPCGIISRAALLRWLLAHHWQDLPIDPVPAEAATPWRADGDPPPLLQLATRIASEAEQLRDHLQLGADALDEAPLVGGASRLQQLVDDLLAGSGCSVPTGGGVPY